MNKIKKATSILLTAVSTVSIGTMVLLLLLAVCGIRLFTVESGSMEPLMKKGDAALVSIKTDPDDIQEGDVIVYDRSGMNVIHRVIGMSSDGWILKGDANEKPDSATVRSVQLVGRELVIIPGVGGLIDAIKDPRMAGIIAAVLAGSVFLSMGCRDKAKPDGEESECEE